MHDKRLSLCGKKNEARIDYSNATVKDLVTLPNGKRGLKGPGRISYAKLKQLRMENMNDSVERGDFKGPFGPGTTGLKTTKNMHLIPQEMQDKTAIKKSVVEPIKKATKEIKTDSDKKHTSVADLLNKIKSNKGGK